MGTPLPRPIHVPEFKAKVLPKLTSYASVCVCDLSFLVFRATPPPYSNPRIYKFMIRDTERLGCQPNPPSKGSLPLRDMEQSKLGY